MYARAISMLTYQNNWLCDLIIVNSFNVQERSVLHADVKQIFYNPAFHSVHFSQKLMTELELC